MVIRQGRFGARTISGSDSVLTAGSMGDRGAPKFSICNPCLMPMTPCRQTLCRTKLEKQVGPCHVPSLSARRIIRVASRQHMPVTAELSALCERHLAIEILCKENCTLKCRMASVEELRELS